MADVFVSYAREDAARAGQVARAFQAMGLDVFWDSEIPPGQSWADYIESKLSAAKVMVVLWSHHSTSSQWVREEARIGRDKGKLIPVMIETVSVPLGFGEVQAANLTDWSGDPNHPGWRRLADAVCAAAGVAPRAVSTPPPPQFAQPVVGATALSGGAANPSPIDYIKKCFALYLDGKGRARRSEYWWWVLFAVVLVIVAAIIDVAVFGVNPYTQVANAPILTFLVCLGILCPSVSVGARRLHDAGLNGWLYLLVIIPYIGWLFMLVVGLMPSKAGANRYGPNPKLASA